MQASNKDQYSGSFIARYASKQINIGLFICLCTITTIFTGCAGMGGDPSLAPGVQRKGGGLYSISEMDTLFGDPAERAVQQCQMDGNKKLSIVTSTTKNGMYSGTTYAVLLFRCE
jgi:hypothetical protein